MSVYILKRSVHLPRPLNHDTFAFPTVKYELQRWVYNIALQWQTLSVNKALVCTNLLLTISEHLARSRAQLRSDSVFRVRVQFQGQSLEIVKNPL